MPDTYQNPGYASRWTSVLFTLASIFMTVVNIVAWIVGAPLVVAWGWSLAPFLYLVGKSVIFNLIFNAVHGAVRQAENDANIEIFNDHVNLNKEQAETEAAEDGDVFSQLARFQADQTGKKS